MQLFNMNYKDDFKKNSVTYFFIIQTETHSVAEKR
jgi:hypothetical protein